MISFCLNIIYSCVFFKVTSLNVRLFNFSKIYWYVLSELMIIMWLYILISRKLFFSKEEECIICLENLSGRIWETACKHKFHYNCLYEWTTKSLTCPNCKCAIELRDFYLEIFSTKWSFKYFYLLVITWCYYLLNKYLFLTTEKYIWYNMLVFEYRWIHMVMSFFIVVS